MTDLVARLLALAEQADDGWEFTPGGSPWGRGLREAADALGNLQERLDREHSMALSSQQYMEQERDALKAKLAEWATEYQRWTVENVKLAPEANVLRKELAEAEAELIKSEVALDAGHVLVTTVRERAEKAEKERDEARAEAAALREAAAAMEVECRSPVLDSDGDGEWAMPCGECVECVLIAALSQPGPGAALLDQVRLYRAERMERERLPERVKKLEAVAEAANRIPSVERSVMLGNALAYLAAAEE